jgi:competence protein ComEC
MDRAVQNFWHAPLAPVALAATAGVVADRLGPVTPGLSLVTVAACLAAWAVVRTGPQKGLALLYLWGSVAGLGAAYHHWYLHAVAADDIGHFATAEPRPVVLRGTLDDEPTSTDSPNDPLRSMPQRVSTRTVVAARQLKGPDGWAAASGRARLTVTGTLRDLHVGDEVEVVGRLAAPGGPSNPGEFDYAAYLRDQHIRAVISVRHDADGVTCLAHRSLATPAGWLALVRGWAHRALKRHVPEEQFGLATALLLGETWALDQSGWERYQRTGVIHVLAISGQHLSVLAMFLWYALRPFSIRRRHGAGLVALFLLGYALLTGGRPPVMRSAVMACAVCGGLLVLRPANRANLFCLSWLVVGILNPTDFFDGGCQLSFLSVAILFWGLPRRSAARRDPLEQLIDESRPVWEKRLRWLGGQLGSALGVTLAVWLAVAPLVAARYHTIAPSGLLIGVPVVFLTTIALLTGFVVLLLALGLAPLASLAGAATGATLAGCDFLVSWGVGLPGSYWYVSDVPLWWVGVFYAVLFAGLTVGPLRWRWQAVGLALVAWLGVGLVARAARAEPEDELRCTFLSVGHGGCVVFETADGRTLLYDAGTLSGPEVTRRFIAPYLWSRGIRRIDEVFVSHAHLDHFNGLTALFERFAIGQVSCTPSFTQPPTLGAQLTLDTIRQRGIPLRVVRAGDRLSAGDVSLEVLHPPAIGPAGKEDVRSLVLLVRHRGHAILLTGDLEVPGQERLFASVPPTTVDVLQAPHHGSRTANNVKLAAWARPKVVVSCQGPPVWPRRGPDPYQEVRARLLTTWEHGAVTVHSSTAGLVVETYRTRERWHVGR